MSAPEVNSPDEAPDQPAAATARPGAGGGPTGVASRATATSAAAEDTAAKGATAKSNAGEGTDGPAAAGPTPDLVGTSSGGSWTRRASRLVLRRAVRGRTERGGEWGEAMLAEFEETRGGLESVRWALGGALVSWWRRGTGRSPLPRPVPAATPGLRRELRLAVLAVVAVVVGTALLRSVVSVAYIPSASMEPTLRIGDRYLVDRFGFQDELRHGDVVLVRRENHDVVKRVVGVAGDTIDCTAGAVRRNGRPVDEPYLPAGTRTDCSTVTVPADSLYVLGDHRAVSLDSRTLGTVTTDAVSGRILTRVWPLTY